MHGDDKVNEQEEHAIANTNNQVSATSLLNSHKMTFYGYFVCYIYEVMNLHPSHHMAGGF
jgi:hypothetical protein